MKHTQADSNATVVDVSVEERVRHADSAALADTLVSANLALDDTMVSADAIPGDTLADARQRLARGSGIASAATSGDAVTYRRTVLPTISQAPEGPGVRLARAERERYQEHALLGAGGMGEVVSVTDHDIGRDVAMKRLRSGVGGDSGLARFVEEVRTVGRLEHPNIVPIHDVGVDSSGRFFFIMKKIDGDPLDAIISRLQAGDPDTHARYSFERRARIVMDILDAVSFAHSRGIIHRDIKPANVMIGRHGEVILMDWGLAKEVGKADIDVAFEGEEHGEIAESQRVKLTHRGDLLGTPAYMSPEQARGDVDEIDERSDIYALGVLFYEFMTLEHYLGEQPSVISTLRSVAEGEHASPALVRHPHQPPAPAEFCHVIGHAMAKDPSRRYPTADAMSGALQAALDGDFAVECHVTLIKKATYKLLRAADHMPHLAIKLKIGAALLVLLLLGAAALLWRLLS